MVATTRRQLAGVGWVPRHPLPHGSLGRVAGHLSSGPGEEEEKKEEEEEKKEEEAEKQEKVEEE